MKPISYSRQLSPSTWQNISWKTHRICDNKVWITVVLFALSAAILLGKPTWGAAASAVSRDPSIEIAIQDELLTVYAKNATLEEVLLAIGNTVDFNIVIRGELPPERATWSFIDLSLQEVIRCLIGRYNMAMFYDATDRNRVSKLFVYSEGDGAPSKQPFSRLDAEPKVSDETRLQIKTLESNLGDPDAAERIRVVSLLGAIGSDHVVPILGQVLFGDSDPAARLAAVEALARQQGEAAKAFLEAAIKDKDPAVRETASLALERKQ